MTMSQRRKEGLPLGHGLGEGGGLSGTGSLPEELPALCIEGLQ